MQRLSRHPSIPATLALEIDAEARAVGPGSIAFRYRVAGDVGAIRVPGFAVPRRLDELWRHTCFEAFLRPADADHYLELNFSPSGEWAAYAFTRYRERAAPPTLDAPVVRCMADAASLELEATVRLDTTGFAAGDSALGLAAVIEDTDGRLSYWALQHPRTTPDFHVAAGWTGRLGAAARERRA